MARAARVAAQGLGWRTFAALSALALAPAPLYAQPAIDSDAGQAEVQPQDAGSEPVVAPPVAKPPPTVEPPPSQPVARRLQYTLERIEIVGNERTRSRVIRRRIPLRPGDAIDPESEQIEAIEFRLMGTGWFSRVNLKLERGKQRGWVVLVVQVVERNTLVIDQVALGVSEGIDSNRDELSPYLGGSLVETNLLGRGIRASTAFLVSRRQQGIRLSVVDPFRIRNNFSLDYGVFFNNGREFFGNNPLVSLPCSDDDCDEPQEVTSAVVRYRRGGFSLGTGRDVGTNAHYSLGWQGEIVGVVSAPEAASEQRGHDIVPIDFGIDAGRSFVSILRFGFVFDKRDDPGFTSRGTFVSTKVNAGTRLLGSDYDFFKVEGTFRRWWKLRWGHVVRLGGFAGIVLGDAPFFYKFHVSDLTDLIPSRILEMQLDRRPPPNLLNTSIEVMRTEELGVRFDIQYEVPVVRNRRRGLRALNFYLNLGVYSLADLRDPKVGIPGYGGAARVPIDLTFDMGFRFDTRVGVLQVGFSNLLGFLPW